jgi:hypothetical protein
MGCFFSRMSRPVTLVGLLVFRCFLLHAQTPPPRYRAVLTRFEVSKGGRCGFTGFPNLPYVDTPFTTSGPNFIGTTSVEQSCAPGSSAKGTFTTTLPLVINGGRPEPGVPRGYRFDDPIQVNLNFTVELSYPNATAAMISVHVPFENTQGFTGPERGGNCPDGSYTPAAAFQGTTTKTASMNCTLSPVQRADERNGVLEMRINTWTGCCALIPASGQ